MSGRQGTEESDSDAKMTSKETTHGHSARHTQPLYQPNRLLQSQADQSFITVFVVKLPHARHFEHLVTPL
jgi:hypothetical protein